MDFTRKPIIETVITAREGCKLVIRSSKNIGQEEYFVDAVELVSFGSAFFFRSLERPKCFVVPVSDYEVLEIRENRMILKTAGGDRGSIKIASAKESHQRPPKEIKQEEPSQIDVFSDSIQTDEKSDKKPQRRRPSRRRRGREDKELATPSDLIDTKANFEEAKEALPIELKKRSDDFPKTPSALLPPPLTLISDTIAKYKDNEKFKDAFYEKIIEESRVQPVNTVKAGSSTLGDESVNKAVPEKMESPLKAKSETYNIWNEYTPLAEDEPMALSNQEVEIPLFPRIENEDSYLGLNDEVLEAKIEIAQDFLEDSEELSEENKPTN